ncbi:MAG: hypothetical protein UW22_C0055G0009 [Candidatus Gottesmanbacteria bacterium GW2011_GWB1_44_11c]|uniref:Addiction module antitoxin, RelB/DinJ family n=2 Tax=Candidatus Gottesmaniibacteriota TaxID=1752720 RepID=A0A0G1IPA5_9BACT|nr:MAG: hypothetical protein UW22_C0055G0009 [Candidatus Gottesmanbacteria bacterium GW2011_GWB1_44_11c]KKT61000.1 MAG: hypothetical protein UW52_C0013G0002 [Candidatus Gottesmanbacteria bacterium GW2011_GWA1_44_24b]
MLTVRTDKKIKAQAMKIASGLGFSLSTLVNAYLRNLVRTKRVHFADDVQLEPTPYLKRILRQSDKDRKNGKYVSFDTPEKAIAFLDSIAKK